MQKDEKEILFRKYELTQARATPSEKNPAVHQRKALDKLRNWFDAKQPNAGTILSLPTGGGKTFVAVRFLCTGPLSNGYKVLWLAHTHHLLVQAFWSFGPLDTTCGCEVGYIEKPKDRLTVRVVSGAAGHCRVKDTESNDDVVIATLQSVVMAIKTNHPNFRDFLDSAGGRLVVVFDEAHHSPAPSYRKLIEGLRAHCPKTFVLGLTATPTYGDTHKRGWLGKIFPQGIVHQEKAEDLMKQGILARPHLVPMKTDFKPKFDESDYRKWVGSFQDVPEAITTQLAKSRERNAFIAKTYVANKEKYGKTIIFADRWYQCVDLCEMLKERDKDIRVDWVFSYKDGDIGRAEGEDLRSADHNDRAIEKFRNNELDVLINIWMLSEGTDFPKLQTVFITRQTTSEIRLAQMVGRALRGTKFGGTEEAYIVSFVDDWADNRMPWASGIDILGEAKEAETIVKKALAVEIISIELIRRLVRQMNSGLNVNPGEFLSFFPVGWYFTAYQTLVPSTEPGTKPFPSTEPEKKDEEELVRQTIMVFEDDKAGYDDFMAKADGGLLKSFAEETLALSDRRKALEETVARLFPGKTGRSADEAVMNLFHIARHMAKNEGERPRFYLFDERKNHDLDIIAKDVIDRDLGDTAADKLLQSEYIRPDRYWRSIYPRLDHFESDFDGCKRYLKSRGRQSTSVRGGNVVIPPELRPPPVELTQGERLDILRRDKRCLCCGSTRKLQVDHIKPWYLGGGNDPDNLQALCERCNAAKGTNVINFRSKKTMLKTPPGALTLLEAPEGNLAKDPAEWEMFLRQSINFFYRCAAVNDVKTGQRGERLRRWNVWLFSESDASWLEPHKADLVRAIRVARDHAGVEVALDEIIFH
jgi:ATP-dependent helicase IRC3